MSRYLLWFCLLLLPNFLWAGDKWALIIGISQYHSVENYPKIEHAATDAVHISQALTSEYGQFDSGKVLEKYGQHQ